MRSIVSTVFEFYLKEESVFCLITMCPLSPGGRRGRQYWGKQGPVGRLM